MAVREDIVDATSPGPRRQWVRRPRASTFALAVCTAIIAWFVLVPVAALIFTAFAEDTPYGPGAFTLENFVAAYTSPHLYRLFLN